VTTVAAVGAPESRDLSLAEWVVLTLVDTSPSHGFAIGTLTAADGRLGRVWVIPRPVVYRALGRLAEAGLVAERGHETGPGPQRTVYAATAAGREAVAGWLAEPVHHIRDVRSEFLVKLALLDRRGADAADLVAAQRVALRPLVDKLTDAPPGTGFERTLARWREANARAAVDFLGSLG